VLDVIMKLIFRQFVDDVGVIILVNHRYICAIKYFRRTKCYQV